MRIYESIQSEFEKLEHVSKINEDDQNKFTLFASNGTEVIPKIFKYQMIFL